jgi:hypothetical protein
LPPVAAPPPQEIKFNPHTALLPVIIGHPTSVIRHHRGS